MRFAIVEAPSILGLTPSGVQELPAALLEAGLAARLGARRAATVQPPPYDERRDPEHGFRNAAGISRHAIELADAIGAVIAAGETPVVLGGDCSILLGSMLALRRRGRYGLLFADGHTDFYQPAANVNGQAASSDLALATGHGPAVLTDLEGRAPLVREEDVVAFGRRDGAEAAGYGSDEPPEAVRVIDLAAIRAAGIDAALTDALARVIRPGLAGFWLHLDADVLDDAIMPAVDYRLPGGLSWSELEATLRAARATGRLAGLEVTIFNPRLDPTGAIARALTDALVAGLTPAG
jgi:arginase